MHRNILTDISAIGNVMDAMFKASKITGNNSSLNNWDLSSLVTMVFIIQHSKIKGDIKILYDKLKPF